MFLIKLFNAVKINILNKKIYFYFYIDKQNQKYLKKLIQLNIIKGVKALGNNKIKVFITYINGKPLYKNIKLLYKPSNKFIVNLNTLKKIHKYKNVPVYLLFTNKGFLTNMEAITHKTGGILFCRIN
jgi:ribosomal protein S8